MYILCSRAVENLSHFDTFNDVQLLKKNVFKNFVTCLNTQNDGSKVRKEIVAM